MSELHKLLETTGVPVAYNVFKSPQTAPYICYIITNSDNVYADGVVYHKVDNVQIELYTKQKDITIEGKLEKALSSFKYQTDESPLIDEGLYLKTYEIQI